MGPSTGSARSVNWPADRGTNASALEQDHRARVEQKEMVKMLSLTELFREPATFLVAWWVSSVILISLVVWYVLHDTHRTGHH
jgi:hypothetical protein